MKTVSIDELKRNLASMIDEAAAGEHIVITRHRRPVASLTKAEVDPVHIGARVGQGGLRPLLKGPTKGAYLQVLADDRRSGGGRSA